MHYIWCLYSSLWGHSICLTQSAYHSLVIIADIWSPFSRCPIAKLSMTSGNMHFSLVSHALRLGSLEEATLPLLYSPFAASPTASAIGPGLSLVMSSSASALQRIKSGQSLPGATNQCAEKYPGRKGVLTHVEKTSSRLGAALSSIGTHLLRYSSLDLATRETDGAPLLILTIGRPCSASSLQMTSRKLTALLAKQWQYNLFKLPVIGRRNCRKRLTHTNPLTQGEQEQLLHNRLMQANDARQAYLKSKMVSAEYQLSAILRTGKSTGMTHHVFAEERACVAVEAGQRRRQV